jgi:replication factor C subunit 1
MQTVIDKVIKTMDGYFLSKEDWETIVELGVNQNKGHVVLKRISTGVKMKEC